MQAEESDVRQCPFCKEEIKATALRCRYCQSAVRPTKPDHGGVCPFCKEEINPEAIKCRHCKSKLAPSPQQPCCGDCGESRSTLPVPLRRTSNPMTVNVHKMIPRQRGRAEPTLLRDVVPCDGCSSYDVDDAGTWCFLECSEHYCIFELCDPAPPAPYTVFR
jgi:hypothetical protein